MSHVAAVALEIKDLDALEEACKAIGLELVRGQKTYRWYGKWVKDYHGDDAAYKHGIKPEDYGKCAHAVRVKGKPNAYEIGLVEVRPGVFQPVWDFWSGGRGLQAVIGENGGIFKREYALHVGAKDARRKGFQVVREVNKATGKPRLRAFKRG